MCIAAALGSADGVLSLPVQLSRGCPNPLPGVLHSLWSGEGAKIDHSAILADLHTHVPDMRGRGSRQEDLQMIVEAIVDSYLKDRVQELFHFEYMSTLQCPLEGCGRVSFHTDPARTLSLPIHEGCNTLASLLDHAARPGCMGVNWKHELETRMWIKCEAKTE